MLDFSTITKYINKIKSYTIEKKCIYSKVSKSPQVLFNQNEKYRFNERFNEYINIFIDTMSKNPNIDLKLFYKNLKTLIIKEKKLFIETHIKGHYDGYDNKILILKDDNFYSIYHELLHCASRRITENEMNIGFYKFVKEKKDGKVIFKLGKSLTEGYTTLLEKRYFDYIEHNKKRSYVIEEFISSILEKIVGKEEMEKFYFSADIEGLINYLKQFSNEEDIYSFLTYFDKILVTSNNKIKPKEATYIYKFIGSFLLRAYVYKIIMLFKNNEINDDEFLTLIDDFIILLGNKYVLYKKDNYYFLTKDFTDQILDEIYEDLDNKEKNKIM